MKLLPKVFTADKISFQNVVSKRAKFYYSEIEENYQNFVSGIINEGYNLKGPFFYSLNNVPTDEMIDIEMFFPIIENIFEVEDYQFASYFEITPLLKTIIVGDFDNVTEQSYAELLATLEINNLNIETPFFHVFPKNGSKYVNLYVGYYKS
ncbi:DUF5085 family protein [Listeria sp. FSL L7-1509]|uniref:DUF5085 family protein n=1 Tax=Listeria immobilis TaxID=2713502 RepID=A0ABR6SXV4_9LIST|nr:DUF5085 family protein [Listeria immobilis]MBC1483364.1 DUF5085 family protein [Listeria immobilis]MBC1507655.1 DUF5085 family protein [Listeria immobilis]MBC1510520.1 DUF5085 family protein [Listeria immobilis]MBC6303653.1 DUF5085 family protein [Listeria immobilis]MBC6312968.1 DUF5085 family protein [Listeria immobilis]